MTLWIWKGDTHSSICKTSNNTGDGNISQMDKLLSEVLHHLDKCSQSKPIQVRPAILRYNFRNRCFLGLWFSIALVHVFITQFFIIEAPCIHVCLKTLLFMNVLRYSFHYTSKPISLGFPCIHVCLKTLIFLNEFFQ